MQFTTLFAAIFLAATASAAVPPTYSNGTAPLIPSNTTGTAAPSGTTGPGATGSSTASFVPSTGGAGRLSTGAMGLLVVGGVAMAL